MSVLVGDPSVNKFEQVSSNGHQMSLAKGWAIARSRARDGHVGMGGSMSDVRNAQWDHGQGQSWGTCTVSSNALLVMVIIVNKIYERFMRDLPVWTDRYTQVKTLPSRNFIGSQQSYLVAR